MPALRQFEELSLVSLSSTDRDEWIEINSDEGNNTNTDYTTLQSVPTGFGTESWTCYLCLRDYPVNSPPVNTMNRGDALPCKSCDVFQTCLECHLKCHCRSPKYSCDSCHYNERGRHVMNTLKSSSTLLDSSNKMTTRNYSSYGETSLGNRNCASSPSKTENSLSRSRQRRDSAPPNIGTALSDNRGRKINRATSSISQRMRTVLRKAGVIIKDNIYDYGRASSAPCHPSYCASVASGSTSLHTASEFPGTPTGIFMDGLKPFNELPRNLILEDPDCASPRNHDTSGSETPFFPVHQTSPSSLNSTQSCSGCKIGLECFESMVGPLGKRFHQNCLKCMMCLKDVRMGEGTRYEYDENGLMKLCCRQCFMEYSDMVFVQNVHQAQAA
ncbi:hypothetical protein EDC01DRAFT_416135 [Geopyxis carbonaria]|nr:hypothetical protein EDC01DRAFT_416135 [Geopyxis carbonaria]